MENVDQLTRDLYNLDNDPFREIYYKLIKDKLDEVDESSEIFKLCVITTNYYKLCKLLSDDPIYLNGSLKAFEFPFTLEVKGFIDADRKNKIR